MGSLKDNNPNSHECLTQVLDEESLWTAIDVLVRFLSSRNIEKAHAKFGFALKRDLRGESQPEDQTISLSSLRAFVEKGLDEETIEWKGQSDFVLEPIGIDLKLMLCNDADLHFASTDTALLVELGRVFKTEGIQVYSNGQQI